MSETLVNIFLFGNSRELQSLGHRLYVREGSYAECLSFLQSRVEEDSQTAPRSDLPEPLTWEEFYSLNRLSPLTEFLLDQGVAPEKTIFSITPIVDDAPRVDDVDDAFATLASPDYLRKYTTKEGFDFPSLIDDDYYDALRLLWNRKKYISCMKLTFSTIDTLGFIEYGHVNGCFVNWLGRYCDLEPLAVTAEELWELRNSLLHMTNLDSHKVRQGKTTRLFPVFLPPDHDPPRADGEKRLHFARLLLVLLPEAIGRWLQSYNDERKKFLTFVARYDTIVSEARTRPVALEPVRDDRRQDTGR